MPYHFGEIAGLISGLPTGSILDAWVEYLPAVGGSYTRAAAIPIGSQCKFRASVSANSGGGTAWAIVATVIDLYDGALKDYHLGPSNFSVDIAFNDYLQNRHNTPWVMPPHNLNLSFRLFASFERVSRPYSIR